MSNEHLRSAAWRPPAVVVDADAQDDGNAKAHAAGPRSMIKEGPDAPGRPATYPPGAPPKPSPVVGAGAGDDGGGAPPGGETIHRLRMPAPPHKR